MVVVEHRFEPWLEHVDRVIVIGAGGVIESDGSVAEFLAGPTPRGVWMPGAPAPVPPDVIGRAGDAGRVAAAADRRGRRGHVGDAGRFAASIAPPALRRFDGRFDPGTVSALVGPSGSGKSTALAALGWPAAGAGAAGSRQTARG